MSTLIGTFKQHTFKTKIFTEFNRPIILINPEALKKMYFWVQECPKEIGWFGSVERLEPQSSNMFLIKDVYLFKQKVTAVETELDQNDFADFILSLDPNIITSIRLWGHSHVNMDTSGSSTDDETIELFKPREGEFMDTEYFIRLIGNKKGKLEFNIYFFKENILVEDAPWQVADNIEEEQLKALKEELKEKVIQTQTQTQTSSIYTGGYYR